MSRRARLFSESFGEADSTFSTTQGSPTKRRKKSGLNARIDRIVQAMNLAHQPSTRARTRSTSSASGSSAPKTPIGDYYEEYHRDGRLGADFSLLKMGTHAIPRKNIREPGLWEECSSSDTNEPPAPHARLPTWLAETFSTLTTKHPLRLLLPRRTNTEPPLSTKTVQNAQDIDSFFSFLPPADPFHVSSPDASATAEISVEPFAQSKSTPPQSATILPSVCPPPVSLPFSTPGLYSTALLHREPLDSNRSPESVPFAECANYQLEAQPSPLCAIEYNADPLAAEYPAASLSLRKDFTPFILPHSTPPHQAESQSAIPFLTLPLVSLECPTEISYPEHPAALNSSTQAPPFIPLCSAPQNKVERQASAPMLRSPLPEPELLDDDSHLPTAEYPAVKLCLPDNTDVYRENTNSSSLFDPDTTHNPYTDIYSTPGPGRGAPRTFYFDSPTEDPYVSDPLRAGFELDSLDFRWEPFIQKSTAAKSDIESPGPSLLSNSDDFYYETRTEQDRELDDENGPLYASVNMKPISVASPCRFSFWPPDALPTSNLQPGQSTLATPEHPASPERASPPFFAPAPGIFISPLRGGEGKIDADPKVDETASDNLHGSQMSNDTIEDWEEDAN